MAEEQTFGAEDSSTRSAVLHRPRRNGARALACVYFEDEPPAVVLPSTGPADDGARGRGWSGTKRGLVGAFMIWIKSVSAWFAGAR